MAYNFIVLSTDSGLITSFCIIYSVFDAFSSYCVFLCSKVIDTIFFLFSLASKSLRNCICVVFAMHLFSVSIILNLQSNASLVSLFRILIAHWHFWIPCQVVFFYSNTIWHPINIFLLYPSYIQFRCLVFSVEYPIFCPRLSCFIVYSVYLIFTWLPLHCSISKRWNRSCVDSFKCIPYV